MLSFTSKLFTGEIGIICVLILRIVLYHRAVIHHADHCFDKLNVAEIELHHAVDFNKICLFYKLTYWVWFCGNRKLTAEKATL